MNPTCQITLGTCYYCRRCQAVLRIRTIQTSFASRLACVFFVIYCSLFLWTLLQSIQRHGAHVSMSTSDRCWAKDDAIYQTSESFFLYRASKGVWITQFRSSNYLY